MQHFTPFNFLCILSTIFLRCILTHCCKSPEWKTALQDEVFDLKSFQLADLYVTLFTVLNQGLLFSATVGLLSS